MPKLRSSADQLHHCKKALLGGFWPSQTCKTYARLTFPSAACPSTTLKSGRLYQAVESQAHRRGMRTHQKPLVLLRPVIDLEFHHRMSQTAELAPLAAQIWPQILAQSLVGSWILRLHCLCQEGCRSYSKSVDHTTDSSQSRTLNLRPACGWAHQ